MKTLLYLHGLGSNAASRKFISLQQAFGDRYQLHCPEWTTTTVITDFLNNLFNYYEHEKSILIIGSSTGANFAYQLTQKLRRKGVIVELILVNPLLSLSQRISLREFSAQLATYLQDIVEVENCKLILSRQDEVIDHSKIMIGKNVSRIAIDDNHKVEDIQNLIAIFKGVLEMKN